MDEPCSRLPGFICLSGIGPKGHLHLDAADITGVADSSGTGVAANTTLILRSSGTLVYVGELQAEVEQKIRETVTLTPAPPDTDVRTALVKILACIKTSADQSYFSEMAAACRVLLRTAQVEDAARIVGFPLALAALPT